MKTWDSDLDDPLFHSRMDAAWNQTNQSADMPEQNKLTDKSSRYPTIISTGFMANQILTHA